MVHYYLLLAHWPSLCYSAFFYWPTGSLYGILPSSPSPVAPSYVTQPFSTGPLTVSMVHYFLLLATICLFGTLPSSTVPLDISMEYNYLLLANWPSLGYSTIFYWLSLWYTTIFYCLTGYLYGTLLSSTCPLTSSMTHYYIY